MGLLAGEVFNLDLPQVDKRLFAFVECDGCGMGGIEIATGCRVDRRTLRVMDYGKLAATFVDTQTGVSVRIKTHPACRSTAEQYAPHSIDAWHRQLKAYQIMPNEALFITQPVILHVSMEKIIGQPGLRANCDLCGEEITNQREVLVDGQVLCRACAGESYYDYFSEYQHEAQDDEDS
jgi:formylmethanofuran dehydrogenase subunit E